MSKIRNISDKEESDKEIGREDYEEIISFEEEEGSEEEQSEKESEEEEESEGEKEILQKENKKLKRKLEKMKEKAKHYRRKYKSEKKSVKSLKKELKKKNIEIKKFLYKEEEEILWKEQELNLLMEEKNLKKMEKIQSRREKNEFLVKRLHDLQLKIQNKLELDLKDKERIQREISSLLDGVKATERDLEVKPPKWEDNWGDIKATVYYFTLTPSLDLKQSDVKEVTIQIRPLPFGKGSFRFAYFAKHDKKNMVLKELILSRTPELDMKEHQDNLRLHLLADKYAQDFNKVKPHDCPSMKYLNARIYKFTNRESKQVVMFGEDLLEGDFEKFNNNYDFLSEKPQHQPAHTFSHYSIYSSKSMMIVDIQGSYNPSRNEFTLTDPACNFLHTEESGSNHGIKGVQAFFKKHVCNKHCKEMKLDTMTKFV